ncbi:hypothetical protein R6Q59_010206 [Mikania micrantha]
MTAAASISMFGFCVPKLIKKLLPFCVACTLLAGSFSIIGSFGEYSGELSYASSLASGQFPKKIWQTWKVDPLDFEERDLSAARTWVQKNPGHRYEVLTDQNDLYYVETHFGPGGLNRPDIVHTYKSLTAKIIKADLLRYLVMYVDGGIYTDIDVEGLRPISRFVPDHYNERDIDMVIGIEIDQPDFKDHLILGPKSQSFCQWTFMCKPRLPVMMRLVEDIIKWLNKVAREQGKPISEITLDFDQVISGTGPSAFTKAVLAEMSVKEGHKITWDPFHDLTDSKLVGGVLVLNVEAFAAGQGHSDSGNHNARGALVKHRYHASGWPTAHPRFTHPIHGTVESCNWDKACVQRWDDAVASFKALSEEEQSVQVMAKENQDLADLAALAGAAAAGPELALQVAPLF